MQPNGGSIRKTAHLCAVEFYGYLNADSAPDPSIGWSEEGGPRGHGACHTNEPLGREVAEIAWLGVGAGNKAQWVKGVAKDAVTYKGATVCRNAGQTASFWPVFGVVATSGQKQYCKWIGAGVYGAGTILDDFETITSGQAVGARTATVNLEDHLPPAARTLSLRGSANNVQKFSGAMVIGEERPTTNADCPLTPQSTANAAGMPRSPAPLPQLPVREIVTPNPAAVRPMEPAQGKTVVPGPPPRVLTAPR
jgi:hypothetical protein